MNNKKRDMMYIGSGCRRTCGALAVSAERSRLKGGWVGPYYFGHAKQIQACRWLREQNANRKSVRATARTSLAGC